MSLEQARGLIYAQADALVPAPVTLTPEQIERIERRSGVQVRAPRQQVWEARSEGRQLGWLIDDEA